MLRPRAPVNGRRAPGRQPVRIGLVISVPVFEDFYPRHGVSREDYLARYDSDWICYYTRLLVRAGFELTWYLFSRAVARAETHRHAPTGARVRFLPASPLYNWWTVRLPWIHHFSLHLATLSRGFLHELRADPPELLYVQDYESGRFDVVSLLAARLGIPVVGQFHGGHSPARWPLRALRRWALRRAALILSPNTDEHRRVCGTHGLSGARAQLFPNPVPVFAVPDREGAEVKREAGIPRAHRYVLFLGRLDANKGVDLLLAAHRELARRFPDLHLVVAGDGPDLEALRRAAEGLPRVHFLGWVASRPRVHALLGGAEAVACPSGEEAFCYVAAEAMTAARPVVASAVGGLKDLVLDGVTGSLIPPRDPAALGAALARLVDDPAASARMGAAGRARIEREFAEDVLVPRLVALLHRAAGCARPACEPA